MEGGDNALREGMMGKGRVKMVRSMRPSNDRCIRDPTKLSSTEPQWT